MAKTEHSMVDERMLEDFFAAARSEAPLPSEGLMARIMADAEAELAARAAPARKSPAGRFGLLATALAAIGGWPALASMVTATLAGVWLGFASPDSLNTLSGGVLLPDSTSTTSYDFEDMLPGYGDLAGLYEEG